MNKQGIEKAIKNMHSHVKAYEDNLRSISTVNSINKDWDGKAAFGQPITIDDKRYVYTVESLEACKLAISSLELQLTNGWIPVSERLPEEIQHEGGEPIEFNVMLKYGAVATTGCINKDGQWGEMCWATAKLHPFMTDVVAWQPLPETYKEVSE